VQLLRLPQNKLVSRKSQHSRRQKLQQKPKSQKLPSRSLRHPRLARRRNRASPRRSLPLRRSHLRDLSLLRHRHHRHRARRSQIVRVRARSFPALRVLVQSRLALRSSRRVLSHRPPPAHPRVFPARAGTTAADNSAAVVVVVAVVAAMNARVAAAKESVDR
jgi:hypothetical protein